MVVKIKIGKMLQGCFYYNENKVKTGDAKCLMAENFPMTMERMTVSQKLHVLQKITSLRPTLKANTLHISLNFDPSEKLSEESLKEIAREYMQQIGFGEQPYLMYQHHDSGHPHLHIVTTKVTYSGGAVDTNYIALKKSEPARKEIEKRFGLVVAEGKQTTPGYELTPVSMRVVSYGKLPTKKAIKNILDGVLNDYKYTSLAELNAILGRYNIRADRGSEKSRTFKAGGLVYRILDEQSKPVGVPVKASDFSNKPTLPFLERKFVSNEVKRQPYKARIKNEIDKAFLYKTTGLDELVNRLKSKGIHVVLRQSETGMLYGLTYVDHQTKSVFNGSALGKQYSAKAIMERCIEKATVEPNLSAHSVQQKNGMELQNRSDGGTATNAGIKEQPVQKSAETDSVMAVLTQSENAADYVAYPFRKKKKKKQQNNPNKL